MSLSIKNLFNIIFVSVIGNAFANLLIKENDSSQNSPSGGSLGLSVRCFWFEPKTFAVFDLNYLKKGHGDDKYNLTEYLDIKIEGNDTNTTTTPTILFNLCGNVKECKDEESGLSKFAQFVYEYQNNSETVCRRYAGNIVDGNEWKLINKDNFREGVIMTLAKGTEGFSMSLTMKCEKNVTLAIEKESCSFGINQKENSLTFKSKYACPETQVYSIWRFIVNKKEIFASLMIVLGIVVMILGFKFIDVTIFIVTCGTVIVTMFIFIYQYIIPSGTIDTVIWLVLSMSILGGLFVSYFVLKFKESAFGIVLGVAVAIVVGQVIYNLILRFLTKWHTLIQAAIYIGLIAVFAVIGKLAFKQFTIIGTSLVGTYLLVRGVSIFVGGFPNETTIIDLISNGETEQLEKLFTPIVYVYLVIWLVASIAAMVCQFKLNEDDSDEINEETLSGKEKAKKKFFLGGLGLDKV